MIGVYPCGIVLPAQAAVMHGVALLDQVYPGWTKHVDVLSLDMMCDGEDCVLGQLYGSYDEGKRRLELSHSDLVYYGFTPACGTSELQFADGETLTLLWRTYIEKERQRPRSG